MMPDWLFEYMIFPLVVFAMGFVYLVLQAWLQLLVLALIALFIYLAVRVRNSGAPILAAIGLGVLLSLAGCQPLMEGETRKITAWGFWAVVGANPIGIGYWHSERGPAVKSEESAKPPNMMIPVPLK